MVAAPTLNAAVNAQSNQITGVPYDIYGNVTQFQSNNLGYDVANRLVSVNGSQVYAYDQGNRRVYSRNSGETLYLYGVGGKKLATYTIAVTNTAISFTLASKNVYFGGMLISAEGNAVAVDGQGSVRSSNTGLHSYYPYGKEYVATTNDTEKYATYTRDSVTSGLDYAMNRYYSSQWGRFMSSDPSWGSVDLRNSMSWNRYTYTLNDPIAGKDPTGLEDDNGGDGASASDFCDIVLCIDGGGGGGGGGGDATQGPGIGSSLTTSNLATDENGNIIVDANGNPVVGDITQAGSSTNVVSGSDIVTISGWTVTIPQICGGTFAFGGGEADGAVSGAFAGGIVEIDSQEGVTGGSLVEAWAGGEGPVIGAGKITSPSDRSVTQGLLGFTGVGISAGPLAGLQIGYVAGKGWGGFTLKATWGLSLLARVGI
jgi:RHS repeat-associated protein